MTSVAVAKVGEPAGKAAVTVTVTEPASSATSDWSPVVSPSVSTVRMILEGLASLSAMDRAALVKEKPAAAPDTVTVSVPSPATVSLVGVKVNVPIPLVAPAAMETLKELTAPKSVPEVAVEPATDTVATVAVVNTGDPAGKEAVTSMEVAPSSSPTLAGLRVRMMLVGAASLSAMVRAVPLTAVKPAAVVVPDTVRLSETSTMLSSATVKVKVPVAEAAPAGMVMLKEGTAVKSAAEALVPATVTFTTVAVVKTTEPAKEAFTVTVVAASPSVTSVCSPTVSESTSRLRFMAVGAESSSLMVIVTPLTVNPVAEPPIVRVSACSAMLSSTAVSWKLVESETVV